MKWLVLALIVFATTAGEVLQAAGMRHHGEIHETRLFQRNACETPPFLGVPQILSPRLSNF